MNLAITLLHSRSWVSLVALLTLLLAGPAAWAQAPTLSSLSPRGAQVGDLITLGGSGFTGTTGVTLGGAAVPGYTVVSNTQIRFNVPAGATPGLVRVSKPAGTSNGQPLEVGDLRSLALTGFTEDVVANGTGVTAAASTSSTFDASANVLHELGYNNGTATAGKGLPVGGFFVGTNAGTPGVPYQLADYGANNSLRLTEYNQGTLVLATPTPVSVLHVLLAASNVFFIPEVNITLTFTDNSTQTFSELDVRDWMDNNAAAVGEAAIVDVGRTDRANSAISTPAGTPRLYQYNLPLDAGNLGKSLQQVTVTKAGFSDNGIVNVMGLSGRLYAPAVISSFTPTSGPEGTTVTVTGAHLDAVREVRINGVRGTITGTPGYGNLTFVAGLRSSTGPLSLDTPSGTTTSSSSFTVPPPVISSFTPTSGPVGTTVTVTGTNLAAISQILVNGVSGSIMGTPGYGGFTFVVGARSSSGPVRVLAPSGSSTSSGTFTVVQEMFVSSLSPGQGLRNAPATTPVALTLNQTLRNDAATRGSLRVFSQQRGGRMQDGTRGSTTVSGATISFDPTTDFRAGETVYSTLTTAARNSANTQSPVAGHVSQFTVAAGGLGRGGFAGLAPPLPLGGSPNSADWADVAVGDVDGDGDLDAVAGSNSATGQVLLNDGQAGLSLGSTVALQYSQRQLKLADVDNDGDLDLLAISISGGSIIYPASNATGTFSVRLNNGSGSFGSGTDIALSAAPTNLAVGDVDGDGDLDAMAWGVGGTLYTFLNTAGTLALTNTQTPGGGGALALADLDQDGDLDIACSKDYNLQILWNGGDNSGSNTGTFSNPLLVPCNAAANSIAIVAADLDNDHDLDLVVRGDLSIVTSLRNGANDPGAGIGSFTEVDGLYAAPFGSAAVGDVDADGDLDVITAGAALQNGIYLFRNGSDSSGSNAGQFGPLTFVRSSPNNVYHISTPQLADMDGDGDLDLVVVSTTQVAVLLNQPAPLLLSATPNPVAAGGTLVVTGRYFTGATGFAFLGNSPTNTAFTINSDTQLTISVPAAVPPGSRTLIVGNRHGNSNGLPVTVVAAPATDLSVSPASVAENQPVGTTVGTFSSTTPTAGSTFTYSFATGGADNGAFSIAGSTLTTNAVFDYEAQSSYSIRVRSTDQNGQFFEKDLIITIGDVDETPVLSSLTPASGPVGASVSVAGSYLGGATGVSFNGVNQTTITANTAAGLTVTVPAGASTGPLTVTTPNGLSNSLTFTVTAASTSTALTSSANPSTLGQGVTLTATVTNTNGSVRPTGTVTFKDGSTTLGTGMLNSSGLATFSTSSLSVGSHSLTAVYAAAPGFVASTSAALTQVVNAASTTTTLSSSANPATPGQSVTLTATVAVVAPGSGTPTGTVTFKDGSTTLGTGTLNAARQATFTTSALSTGSHSLTAVYAGTAGYGPSTSAGLTQQVGNTATATTLSSSLNPSTDGQAVSFTATVAAGSGTPTGTVTFKDGSTTLGTGTLNGSGVASFSTSSLSVGSHSLTAVYGGATGLASSTSAALTQVVNAPPVPAISSLSPSSGPVGTSVVISGSGLGGASSVSFDGVAQTTISANTATSLTVAVPAGATTGDVVVNTPGGTSNALTFTVTPPAPVVTSVAAPADGTYRIGQFLTFLVSFDQPVTVSTAGGTPVMLLTIGSTTRGVTYLSGSTTSTLTFRYLVQAGELDLNGVTLGGSIAANNGTLRNATGTNALLTLRNVAPLSGVLVDGVAPTPTLSTTAPSPSSSSAITVTITFAEPVTGLTAASLTVSNGTPGVLSGSGTTYTLIVTATASGPVTVQVPAGAAEDAAGNPSAASSTLSVTYSPPPVAISSFTPTSGTGGTVVTITGNGFTGATAVTINNGAVASYTVNSDTQLTATVAAGNTTGLIRVTAPAGTGVSSTNFVVGPAVTSVTAATANGTYRAGQVLQFSVVFSQNITVSTSGGTPSLDLTVGSTVRQAVYSSTAGNTASFRYVIVAGDLDTDGVTLGSTINLNGGTIRNSAGADADPDLRNVASAAGLRVDAVAPTVAITSPAGSSTGTSPIPITITFSETVTGFATSDVTVTGGSRGTLSGSGTTYTISVTPAANSTSVTVSVAAGVAPDAAGNGNAAAPAFTIAYVPLPDITSFTPTSGPVGTTVVLTGTYFTGATAVAFNGVAATSFTVTSATRITAVVPVGVSAGKLSVTTANGTALSTGSFAPTVPAVLSVAAPANASYGVGQALDFNVTFDQVVTATGTVRLPLTVGSTARNASYASGNGSRVLTFRYVVVSGELDANGVVLGTSITTVGGGIRNAGNSSANLALNNVAPTTGVLVDGVLPTVALSSPAGSSTSTAPIPLTITFSEPVTGLSLAALTVGNGTAANLSGSGSTYTLELAPVADGPVTVNLAAGAAQDAADNDNTAAPQFSISYTAPARPTITSLSAGAELPGMPVILTGTNFTSGSSVSFGGVAAGSVTYNSPTSLTVVVPVGAAPGSSTVVVTAATGSSTSAPAFEVLQVYEGPAACIATLPYLATGDGQWHYLRLPTGEVVAALRDTRARLGTVAVSVTVTGDGQPVREDGRGRAYLDRNWHLTASGGPFAGSSVALRFFGLSDELARLTAADPAATLANLKATQYSGPNEDCDLGNNGPGESRVLPLAASTPGGVPWFVAQATVADHFSEFYLTGSSAPLPVELLSFTAAKRGLAVQLAWRTASEKNSARFEVERSGDGRTFARIGTVAAQGSTARPTAYTFLDDHYPGDGNSPGATNVRYYRLRQVDRDGSASYSPVRAVTVGGPSELTLSPNPAHAAVAVAGMRAGAAVEVYDALGRAVARATADAGGTAKLALPAGLAAGVYVVRSGAQVQRLAVE
ncbi:Ig-like domain repeat protein [Hymenobacter sp. ASUV-10]|uniref:Ig-like domain repeat protein n=1 Tax=Hymenobacter aranciens TaxID=3063996 RepID=A0ABT9BBP2_9BACT|nr:Ig-like domain repeat protein [Hymenobacter sp. ASUV-10]MDO7875684.1 Ig-like domain repeat protein [Hymenobacter sp. ASUV-10]